MICARGICLADFILFSMKKILKNSLLFMISDISIETLQQYSILNLFGFFNFYAQTLEVSPNLHMPCVKLTLHIGQSKS